MRIPSFDFVFQYYSPYYPPSTWSYLTMVILFVVIAVFLYKYLKEPFPTYILTVVAFLPFILITVYVLAVSGFPGSAGAIGPLIDPDPFRVARRIFYSWVSGTALTLAMLLVAGLISLFKSRRNYKNKDTSNS